MEQPAHDLRPFQAAQANPRRAASLVVVGLIHVIAIYALASGLASRVGQKVLEEIKAEVVQEKPPETPKTPPPPPPEMTKPPPPYVPPPDINLQTEAPTTAIQQVTTVVPPPAPTKPAPPAITAPASIGRPHSCQQKYPPLAVRLGHEGTTGLSFRIGADGSVKDVRVSSSSGHDELDQAAVNCASSWQYKPAIQNNQPVEVPWQTNVKWKLTGG